jgi:Flp pilus assembly protein TadD
MRCRPAWLVLIALSLGCATTANQPHMKLNQQGVDLLARADHAGARAAFEEALQIKPDDPTTHYNLGITAQATGDLAAAEQHFRQSLFFAPDYAPSRHGLSLVLLQQHRRPEAVQLAEAWVKDRPELAAAHAELGWLRREEGDLPSAQARLQHALHLDPNHPRALVEMGMLLETYHFPERARSVYQQVLRTHPNEPEARTARDRLASLQRSKVH